MQIGLGKLIYRMMLSNPTMEKERLSPALSIMVMMLQASTSQKENRPVTPSSCQLCS